MSEQDIKQIVVNKVIEQAQKVMEQSKYPEAVAEHLSRKHVTPVVIFPSQPQFDIVEFDPQALVEAMSTEKLETTVAAVTEVAEKMFIPQLTTQYSFEEISARLRAIGKEPKMSIKALSPTAAMALTGRIYGFPDCCIDAFCNSWAGITLLPKKSKFTGSGFRPCKQCEDTKTQEQLEDEIASRRLMPRPFYLRQQDALAGHFYRYHTETESELYDHLNSHGLLHLLYERPELFDLAKDCWVPVERDLLCYRNEFDTGKGHYYFTDKYQNRIMPILGPNGKVRFKAMKKKYFRTGHLVDPAKAARLLEQYPELYASRDFKFDRSRFTARIGQELFSIKKEDNHNGSI